MIDSTVLQWYCWVNTHI